MASLVIHGDGLSANASLGRPVYVRPVLRPDASGTRETIPHDQLAIDLIHRAVIRMVDTEFGAASPEVRVINFSIGNAYMQLATAMSPWARLLDWLSYRYKILFVISAGNHSKALTYDFGRVILISSPS